MTLLVKFAERLYTVLVNFKQRLHGGVYVGERIYQFKKYSRTLEEYQKHMLELSQQFGIGFDKIVASFVSLFLK